MRFRSSLLLATTLALPASISSTPLALDHTRSGHPAAHRSIIPTLTVHKTPGCRCCDKWIENAKASGFRIEVIEDADITTFKRRAGVPLAQTSCHTTTAGGYFFEGHVPLDLVRKVLETRPALAGLLVPGMPQSAPGMDDGSPHQPYDILALNLTGTLSTYARR